MEFIDRDDELRRLDAALAHPGALAVLWGRRRVGKTRLLLEWSHRQRGLYAVADQSVPPVQRRYLAAAVDRQFPGFAAVEYPDWRSFLSRLADEAGRSGWPGPFVLDELPYLIAADPTLASVLQAWVDGAPGRPSVVLSGSSQRMMHGAILDAGAPLYGRAREAFAVRPLRPGYLTDLLPGADARDLVAFHALWGGMPRYWELAQPFGLDADRAVDTLVLDPAGPLHMEPERLLMEEVPPAMALRPLLDVIGSGAHRVSEIAGRPPRVQPGAATGRAGRDGARAPGDAVRQRSAVRQAEPVPDRRSVPAALVSRRRARPDRPRGGAARNPARVLAPPPPRARSPGLGGAVPHGGAAAPPVGYGPRQAWTLGAGTTLLAPG